MPGRLEVISSRITSESQPFQSRSFELALSPDLKSPQPVFKVVEGSPRSGEVFVIVEYRLQDLPSGDTLVKDSDFMIVDRNGMERKGMFWIAGLRTDAGPQSAWVDFPGGISFRHTPDRADGRLLFVVPATTSDDLSLRFLGRDPVLLSLSR